MSALLHTDRHGTALIAVHCNYRDFTDEEMLWLGRLQQPIAATYRYRAALDRAAARISNVYGGAERERRCG